MVCRATAKPMKETKRALRRHHVQRVKQLVLKQVKACSLISPNHQKMQMLCRYRNRKPCSCWMCGNPRRAKTRAFSRLTRQEQVAALNADEQIRKI